MIKLKFFIVFTLLLQLGTANAASFDCSKAKSFSEKLICNDSELSKKDDELNSLYKKAQGVYPDKKEFKNFTTQLWNEREQCVTEQCVFAWYSDALLRYKSIIAGVSLPKEDLFIKAVMDAQNKSLTAENNMVRGGIKSERDETICSLVGNDFIKNWIGKINKLDANGDGYGILSVELPYGTILSTYNNSFSDSQYYTLIDPKTTIFKKLSGKKVGDWITFSGVFTQENNKCFNEASMRLTTQLSEPEFIFRFTDISFPGDKDKDSDNNYSSLGDVKTGFELLVKSCILLNRNDKGKVKQLIREAYRLLNENRKPASSENVNFTIDYFSQYKDKSKESCINYTDAFFRAAIEYKKMQ
ncbi:hypothetical protein QPC82_003226 [Escherichia coli]|nr:hypothetical protein [Escherichia coli]